MVVAALCAAALVGCGDSGSDERGATAIGLCVGHGGVAALEDDIVICRDQTVRDDTEDRAAKAVSVCRDHGGVVAVEDEIVICRDQTFQEVQE